MAVPVLAALAAAGQPATATADTARIVPVDPTQPEGPTQASIVLTAADGGVTTLGPYRFRAEPTALRRSPDGRWFAVLVGSRGFVAGITIVPADGSPAFGVPFPRTGGRTTVTMPSQVSWSFDSRELVVGWASGGTNDRVLRCPVDTRSCAAVPDVSGMATAVPGGTVTASLHGPLFPLTAPMNDTDDWLTAQQLRGLRTPRRERIVLVTDTGVRTLADRRRSALAGLEDTMDVVGGPSGALITHDRFRITVVRRGKRRIARPAPARRSWTLVTPNGALRTVVAPRLAVPKAHGSSNGGVQPVRAQHAAIVVPVVPHPTGGWLGTTGYAIALSSVDSGLVLTRISSSGAARFVRTGNDLASAAVLARPLANGRLERGSAALSVVGHEAATDAAIVLVAWTERGSSTTRFATVRVPLDGTTAPTVVSRTPEQAAW